MNIPLFNSFENLNVANKQSFQGLWGKTSRSSDFDQVLGIPKVEEVCYYYPFNDETPEQGYENGNCFGHFAFSVKSLDEFTEKINKLGYEYLYEPFDLNGKGTKIAFIKDPDGNEIELIEKVIW